MKFKSEKTGLLNAVQRVYSVISVKAPLPILANILIETSHDSIRLTATDLDIGISCVLAVEILEQGAITVPAKRLVDIIRELPSEKVSLHTKKNNLVTIETETCQFKLMGIAREEFPKLPEFKDKEALVIDQAGLRQMLNLTAFAASADETRYVLNGILFKISRTTMTLVSTDGKRLAVIDKKIQGQAEKDVSMIIPIKTIHELNRNLREEGQLSIIVGQSQVLFDLGDVVIISRLIEGEFPDYRQVIPPQSENKISVDRTLFLLALKRASLLSTPDYQAVKFEIFKNKILVSKSTPDVGESREEIPVGYSGKELAIGFNPHYIIDVLKNLDQEKVEFEITDSEKPGVIRTNGYVYIVLPMRLG
jgi:DNA polymerase III subunit beta